MKERPILFSAPMVRAILEGRKTQTRRIVKQCKQLDGWVKSPNEAYDVECTDSGCSFLCAGDQGWTDHIPCPHGAREDRLWVKETWSHVPVTAYRCSDGVQQTQDPNDPDLAAVYACGWDRCKPGVWRPSIFMPRWASRISLEIEDVRVERLNDISEEDAKAEGVGVSHRATLRGEERRLCVTCGNHVNLHVGVCKCCPQGYGTVYSSMTFRGGFQCLWESINGPGSWDANPWVWVIQFRKL